MNASRLTALSDGSPYCRITSSVEDHLRFLFALERGELVGRESIGEM